MERVKDSREFLEQLSKRISEIEERLNRIEYNKLVFEETKVIARESELEGKTYTSTPEGGVIKEIRVPVCDVCGETENNFNICVGCKRKLCKDCSINFRNRIFCSGCLNEILPLSKSEYKVLVSIAIGLKEPEKIAEASNIKESLVREFKRELEKNGLILNKGLLFFKEIDVSEKGLEAIFVYQQLYGKEEDIKIFEDELRRILSENC